MKKQLHYNWGHEDDRDDDLYLNNLPTDYEDYSVEEMEELIAEKMKELGLEVV
ncbi:hypothetical protein [Dolosigranulum pigrum]|jgi:hypothetical protein|uniref:hypothetical protein n=1 Tax=Dolosigranulum pigrum TaxID=29394 RepID=UPI001AD884A0|nr:hypothetical protein [Dolosigranulum pigrum]